ncbi:hypothetical protein ACFQ07_06650, partial [Actinomadura adrarensis]
MEVVIRSARTADVQEISRLIGLYAGSGRRVLRKSTVKLYEDVQEFWVAEEIPPAPGRAEPGQGEPGRTGPGQGELARSGPG